jgi:putative redox protein
MQTAVVRWVGKEQFQAVMPSGHAVPMDGDRQTNTGPSPMEILLGALGACTAVDVVLILAKKRQRLDSLEVVVNAERANATPATWAEAEIVYRLTGELEEQAVKHAIELSQEKYCSVAANLRGATKLSYRYEILPSAGSAPASEAEAAR